MKIKHLYRRALVAYLRSMFPPSMAHIRAEIRRENLKSIATTYTRRLT